MGVLGVGRNPVPSRITIMDTDSIRLSDGPVPDSMGRQVVFCLGRGRVL